jgi:selenide,water dikinase
MRLVDEGVTTGGAGRNKRGLEAVVQIDLGVPAPTVELLFDPQTSGGLLVALPPPGARALVERLRSDGLRASLIGRVEPGSGIAVVP